MLRTTFSKLKKACSSLAPRVLRGDTRASGKFQKLSINALRKAEKSTKSGRDKNAEYEEKCKHLIELIFGSSKPPDTTKKGLQKPKISVAGLHQNNELYGDKLAEKAVPHVQERTQCEKHEGLLESSSEVPFKYNKLHATTVKQTEEQLAQKVETISETPLVEAENPIIDGFNVPPRALGGAVDTRSFQNFENRKFDDFEDIGDRGTSFTNAKTYEEEYNTKATVESIVRRIEDNFRLEDVRRLEEIRRIKLLLSNEIERSDFKLPIYNFASDRQSRKSGASAESDHPYDELAKRCLDAPSGNIDERLLKEMEKLGVPQTSSRGETSVIEENIVQIEVSKKPRRPVKKTEIDLETREFQRDHPIVDKLHPTFQMANSLKAISEDVSDNITLKSERLQLYAPDKKPQTYSEDSTMDSEPVDINAQEDNKNVKPRPNHDPNQAIIDPYDKKNIAHDKDEEEYDPLWYQKYSCRQVQKSEEETVEETSKVETDEAINHTTAAHFSDAHQVLQNKNNLSSPESHIEHPIAESEPYRALKNSNEAWQYSELAEPITNTQTRPEQLSAQPETVVPDTTPTEHETIQISIQIDPIKPEIASGENAATKRETFHYSTQHEPMTIQESNTPKVSDTLEYYTQSEHTTTSELKHPKETFQYITHPQSTPTSEPHTLKIDRKPFEFDIREPAKPTETSTEKLLNETFHYSTPPKPEHTSESTIEHTDVTYIEPRLEETDKTIEKNNPDISTEQISHSFEPQTMVSPSKTPTEPAAAIEKTLSACGAPPEQKPNEEVSLSEMLRRVRMRSQMQHCQAHARHVDPVTGKCGKKTPPCPPPAPKCPPPCPCPTPSEPVCPPPPAPRPCKPACPPPCPPPCPPKKNPCQKFKKHFPSINLKNIISLLHQPESDVQKTAAPCGNFLERSRAVWSKQMSLKLQDIGINLLVVCPYQTFVSFSINLNPENLTLARNFEPWVPIPSWPIPKKKIKRPLVCPKEGCKIIPPPKLRPACNENPCANFPRRSNSFSISNLIIFSVGDDYILFDILN